MLRQRLLHSTIIVTAISIATVAIITESVIPATIPDPAVSNDPWLVACETITLVVGEGERFIGVTMVVPSCSGEASDAADGEAPDIAGGETVFVGEVSVCSGDWVVVIS